MSINPDPEKKGATLSERNAGTMKEQAKEGRPGSVELKKTLNALGDVNFANLTDKSLEARIRSALTDDRVSEILDAAVESDKPYYEAIREGIVREIMKELLE